MKRSKKFRIMTVIAILMSTLLFAQPGGQRPPKGGPPPMPNEAQIEQMVNELSSELSLSSEQKAEVSELYEDHFEDVKKLMKKGQKAQNKQKSQMDKLKKELDESVKKVLTEKKQKGFEEYLKTQGHGPRQSKSNTSSKLKQPR